MFGRSQVVTVSLGTVPLRFEIIRVVCSGTLDGIQETRAHFKNCTSA